MAKVTQLFLSAATSEFGEHRALLSKQLHRPELTVAVQDQFINSGGSTLEKLDEYVRHCDAVIHLVGYATGSIPEVPAVAALKGRYPDLAHKFPELADLLSLPQPGLSYTQWEAWLALYHGHSLYMYVAEDFDPPGRALTVPRGPNFEHSADEEAAQREHLNRLRQRGKDRQTFANTQELSIAVLRDLADILAMAKADPAVRGRLFQLPARTLFVGRTQDLEALRAIDPVGGAIITGLKGMGGIGKTALARELAHEWKPRFPDAQLWLDGRGTAQEPTTPERLLEQVLLAFHPESKFPDNLDALSALYRQVLTGKQVLVVLDNAHDDKQAKGLLPPEGCGLIVTSRVVVNLGVGTIHKVGKLPDDEAAVLLREQYPPLTDDEARDLVQWCAGLPLALRLAGGWLRADAVDRDGGRANVAGYLRMLRGGRMATLDREASDLDLLTIRETLALSERPLAEEERTAWRKLGVFAGSFNGVAAREVAGADDSLLTRLVRRSLLEREGDRYRLHDLAAEYALERQRETDTEVATRLAHARHYAAVGASAQTQYLAGDAVGGLALFDRERGELEAAFRWLAGQQAEETDRALIELVNGIVYTGQALRFHPREKIAWLEQQRDAARRVGDRPAEECAHGNLGNAYASLGDVRRAIEFHKQALVFSHAIGDRRGEGTALGNLGLAYADLGDARRAIEFHEQALGIARKIGDRRAVGRNLCNLGLAFADLGDARRAIEFYEQALAIRREIGDLLGEAYALGCLGIAYKDLGDARRAIEFYEQQLAIVREIGDRRGEGVALGNLGIAYGVLGEARRAIEFCEQQLVIDREIGDRRGEGIALGNLGAAYADLGDARRAIEFYDQQIVIVREIGDRRGEGNALYNSAVSLWKLGERDEAVRRAETALAIYVAIESPHVDAVRHQIATWRNA
jgi:tetratricopeptide (TPR) repeat protein